MHMQYTWGIWHHGEHSYLAFFEIKHDARIRIAAAPSGVAKIAALSCDGRASAPVELIELRMRT